MATRVLTMTARLGPVQQPEEPVFAQLKPVLGAREAAIFPGEDLKQQPPQQQHPAAWHVGADPDQRDGKAAVFVCGVYRGSLKKGPKIHFRAELLFVSCFRLRGAKWVWYEHSLDRAGGNVAFAHWRVHDKCFTDDCTQVMYRAPATHGFPRTTVLKRMIFQ
uniref:Uncharacterized protein n=1 Tax=Catharus ustulatus TaxID=91951 RepID=A0A8C3Y2D2_CATUS